MNNTAIPSQKVARALLAFGLVMLCVNLSWTQGFDNRNLLLPVVMCCSPLVLLMPGARVLMPRLDLTVLGLCVCATLSPLLFHPDTFRWGALLFLYANCFYFAMLMRLVKMSDLRAGDCLRFVRWMVYAFTVVLLVQQLCVLAGWPIFNRSHVYDELPWKLNSLATEAAHISYTLGVLMCLYGMAERHADPDTGLWTSMKKSPWLWAGFLWCCVSTINSSALMFIPLAFVPYMTRRNLPWVAGALVLILGVMFLVPTGKNSPAHRVKSILTVNAIDRDSLIKADPSIAHRTIPTYDGAKAICHSGIEAVTGHGVDSDLRDFERVLGAAVREATAGAFKLWYNNGILAEAFLLALIFQTVFEARKPAAWLLTLLAILMTQQYNFQLFWQLIAFSAIYKYTISGKTRFLKEMHPIRQ